MLKVINKGNITIGIWSIPSFHHSNIAALSLQYTQFVCFLRYMYVRVEILKIMIDFVEEN